jgi:hypothetical protein
VDNAREENDMAKQADLACEVCREEFLVPVGVYRSHSRVLICPCCGSTEIILLGVREAAGEHADGAAA